MAGANRRAGTIVANPRINPEYGPISMMDGIADSHYEALQVQVNHRYSKGFQAQLSYTFSKSIDSASGAYGLDGGGAISDPVCAACDRGLSNFSRTNNFRLSAIYDIPFKVSNRVANQFISGWQMTGIYTYLSGAPFSVGSIGNWLYTSSAYSGSRPDAVANCKLYTGVSPEQATTKPWFNASCFTPAPVGVFGNAGRDTIIGPNLWGLDSSLGKNWKVPNISEAFTVQFRAEAFNLLNHPTFQNPGNGAGGSLLTGANVFNNSGGTATINGSAGLLQATNSSPRQIQLALKIGF